MEKIVICVCTRERPKMLDACLLSLMRQRAPEGVSVEAVVVDNELEPNNRAEVERFATAFPFQLNYVHQPDQGIPQARNAALDKALKLGADWIAFIDDDEEAEADWLEKFKSALAHHGHYCRACGEVEGVDVVQGKSEPLYPPKTPDWMIRGRYRRKPESGFPAKRAVTAVTNNVFFSTKLVKKHKLRFNNSLRFIGGEDLSFFRAMYDLGAVIIMDSSVKVRETIPPERATVRWQIRNAFRKGVCRVHEARFRGKRQSPVSICGYVIRKSAAAVGKMILAPALIVLKREDGLYVGLSGLRSAAEAVGCIYGVLGGRFEYYRRVTGS